MKVKTNVSTILVSEENRYVSLGLNIPDIEEIQIFDVNFIKNTHNWGITVVDPDGKTTTKLTKICKSSLEVEIFLTSMILKCLCIMTTIVIHMKYFFSTRY